MKENGFEAINNPQENFSPNLEEIRAMLHLKDTEEEKKKFQEWKEKLTVNSFEKPITIRNINEIVSVLPTAPNSTGKKIEIFFKKDVDFTDIELQQIFKNFSASNPEFEIGVTRFKDEILSIDIGNKERSSNNENGEYFGHYHPISNAKNIQNQEKLPESFLAGLMPSRGDLIGWEKFFKKGQKINRIFSKNGYIEVGVPDNFAGFSKENLEEFGSKYFDLFYGKNSIGIKTEEEMIDYFNDKFALTIKIHKFDTNEKKTNELEGVE